MSLLQIIKTYIIKNFFSIVSYLTVGVLSAIIYFTIFTVQLKFLNIHYELAATIGYVFAILFHFNANRRITFKSHHASIFQHTFKYGLLFLFNYCINITILHFSVEKFHLSPYVGAILGIAATTGTGYLLSRYWVFTTLKKIT